jgi:hypothetical protein
MKKSVSVLGFSIGAFALTLQLYLILSNAYRDQVSYKSEVIRFFSYMTIWTNILVTLCFGCIVIFPKTKWGSYFSKPEVQAAAFIYILVVGVAYHFLLANIWNPTGLQYLADVLLHYGVPMLYILFWIFLAEKKFLSYTYSFAWLIYPFVYFIYSLVRGEITNAYPYPFVDVNELGYSVVFLASLILLVVYWGLGMFTVWISRVLSKRTALE